MKAAKPPAVDTASHRRAQPVRQTRTNPARSSVATSRVAGAKDLHSLRPVGDQPIDIFPAITHFADTITALPKELVRHFTLLKEVDAKIFTPQEQLFKLVSAATSAPLPEARAVNDASSTIAPTSAPMSAQGSSTGYGSHVLPQAPSVDETASSIVFDPCNIPRRQLFRQTAYKIQEMLVSLEEKNHVISTANEALQRQLARVEDVWPYLENEFSDEAKWGSTTHWAYPENRSGRAHPEKIRRDGAAAISAAAQALADEAAARSDARKQAVQAKRNQKNNQHDSDADEVDGRHAVTSKKSLAKVRRAADNDSVGLGISSTLNGNPQKRRKVEKVVNGGTAMERSISSALGSSTSKGKAGSPRNTPVPDGTKKRKALPTASSQGKKKNGVAANSPSTTSSPVLSVHPEPKTRASPAPTSAPRPTSSRARQNSVQSTVDVAKARPPSSTSGKVNGNAVSAPEDVQTNTIARASTEPKPKDTVVAVKEEQGKKDVEEKPDTPPEPATRRESKVEEPETRKEPTPAKDSTQVLTTTKSGRASKPSTPALATFEEAAATRSSRTRDAVGVNRRNQKKSNPAVQALAQVTDEDTNSSIQGDEDEGDIDADEPRYCYCNGVSYGEMVACDSDDCAREWFHLACVGLKVAPGSKTKWYCEDCKERLKLSGKKVSSR